MKEKYTKPSFKMESFTLTQTVASGCGVSKYAGSSLGTPSHTSKSTCGWSMGGIVLWASKGNGCNEILKESETINGICYNNPDGGANIFAS